MLAQLCTSSFVNKGRVEKKPLQTSQSTDYANKFFVTETDWLGTREFVENRVVAGNCVQVIGNGELSAY